MSSILNLENISVRVASQTVCEGLTLEVNTGMCVGILGANGAGKTTLLHCVSGIKKPDAGCVKIHDTPLMSLPAKKRAHHLSVLLQQHTFVFPATVLEAAMVSRYAYSKGLGGYTHEDIEKVQAALKNWGLANKQSQMVGTLSGGETQRLALAMVAAQETQICVLDEPVNNLDLRYHRLVTEIFGKDSGKATLVVLHDLLLVPKMCSHLLLLKEGQYLFGSVADLYTQEKMQWLYGVEMQAVKIDSGGVFYLAV